MDVAFVPLYRHSSHIHRFVLVMSIQDL